VVGKTFTSECGVDGNAARNWEKDHFSVRNIYKVMELAGSGLCRSSSAYFVLYCSSRTALIGKLYAAVSKLL